MKTIVDFGKHTKLVLENEKDEKDFLKFHGCLILLFPVLLVIALLAGLFLFYLVLSLAESLLSK